MWHDRQSRTSEQRVDYKKGGRGGHPPRLFASGLSLEKAWIPRPGPGGEPPRRSEPTPVPTRFPPCQRQPGAACPLSGCLGSHPRGAAPRGPRLPGGGPHFSREMGRKRAGGGAPWTPSFMARLLPLARFGVCATLSRSWGYFAAHLRTLIWRLSFIKCFSAYFSGKCVPNRFWHTGGNSRTTVPEPTIPKTSEWERAAIKAGSRGLPLVFFPPTFFKANCQVKCNTSAGEANRRHFLGL